MQPRVQLWLISNQTRSFIMQKGPRRPNCSRSNETRLMCVWKQGEYKPEQQAEQTLSASIASSRRSSGFERVQLQSSCLAMQSLDRCLSLRRPAAFTLCRLRRAVSGRLCQCEHHVLAEQVARRRFSDGDELLRFSQWWKKKWIGCFGGIVLFCFCRG